MTKQIDNYPDDFFFANRRLLKIGGFWLPEKTEPILKRYGFYFYNAQMIFLCQIYYFTAEIYWLQYTYSDLSKLVEHVGMITQHILGILKMLSWYSRRELFMKIMDTLNDPKYRYNAVKSQGFSPGTYTSNCMRFSAFLSYALLIAGTGVPVSKDLPVLLSISRMDPDLFLNGTNYCLELLPYFSWIPLPLDTKMDCILGISFQAIPVAWFAWQIVAHDALYGAILNSVNSHLDNLKGGFSTIRKRCLQELNLPEDLVCMHDEDIPGLDQKMKQEMKKSTLHLQTILDISNQIENIFTYITLGQVLITLSVFVSRMYLLTTVDLFSGTFTAEVEYLSAVFCQVAIYCAFGNLITVKSSEIPITIYQGDWLSASQSFKKSMYLNMLRMKKPISLTVGKFSPLTLQTLIGIIKGSYSYFAVLKSTKVE